MLVNNFGVLDYLIFFSTLCASMLIGVYFGCTGNKQRTAKEYLFANRNMKAFPVGLSLFSSAVSAVATIGIPADIYMFGAEFMVSGIGSFLSLFITWNLIIPVFCGSANIQTPYEYFELRFSSGVRILCFILYSINSILYNPLILLSICMVVSDATGLSITLCVIIIGGVCVFYTMLGGFSSVIWTDVLQSIILICSITFILIFGAYQIGGISKIWEIANEGQRTNIFNFHLNPFIRISFWTSTFGQMFIIAAHTGCAASSLQRYLTLKTRTDGKICSLISAVSMAWFSLFTCLIGICLYAYYSTCDPLSSKQIENPNQLMTLFVSDVLGHIPGFSGLFYAGIMCAGLSTLSAELNTVSGLLCHDVLMKIKKIKSRITERNLAAILKMIVTIFGVYCLIVTPILHNFKYLWQLSLLVQGFTQGPKLGIMLLGTTFPKCNAKGVYAGTIAAMIFTAWISIGSLYYDVSAPYILPVSTENCTNYNSTVFNSTINDGNISEPFILYKLSYQYYALIGTEITIFVGMIVSYITGFTDVNKIDPRLLVSFVRSKEQKVLES